MDDIISTMRERAYNFDKEARFILSKHEAARTRVITIENTRNRLIELSIQQQSLLNEALFCLEIGLYRAAHVSAWAAFIDYLEQKLAKDGFVKVRSIRERWKCYSIEDLRENVPEQQIIDVAKDLKLISRNDAHILKGYLARRNDCAHPSDFIPDLNESLGYVTDIIQFIEKISVRDI